MSTNPTRILAGPGAGKTHEMAKKITSAVSDLKPYRFLAAVTFTKSAASTIQSHLMKRMPPQENVFIGTTHSFIYRFILKPYATLFNELPEQYVMCSVDLPESMDHQQFFSTRRRLANRGVVSYDHMMSVAKNLLENNKSITEDLSRRLQFLFIDEFQDTHTALWKVFDAIRKAGGTKIYAVGDPEQYITRYTYRGQKPPQFDNIPFFGFPKTTTEFETINDNRRSNGEIVDFLNQFRTDLKQEPHKHYRNKSCVFFIDSTDLSSIIGRFQGLMADMVHEEGNESILYLAYANETVGHVKAQLDGAQLVRIASHQLDSKLGQALKLISVALAKPQRSIMDQFDLSDLQWRSRGLSLLKRCQCSDFNIEQLKEWIEAKFCKKIHSMVERHLQDEIEVLKTSVLTGKGATSNVMCSTIHKAKGLEADAVLVIATTVRDLKKWFVLDPMERKKDKSDTCRLGYVAASRARELLCFACLEAMSGADRDMLQERGIDVVPPEQ